MMKLNLGSGSRHLEGYVNVDNNPLSEADIYHDLNKFPYPFKDSVAGEIIMTGVLEHLQNPYEVVKELYRISKPNATWKILVPHWSRGFLDPTHKSGFTYNWWNPLIKGNQRSNKYADLDIVVQFRFLWIDPKEKKWRPFFMWLGCQWNRVLNWYPQITDRFLCNWFGGIENMRFDVKVLKREVKK